MTDSSIHPSSTPSPSNSTMMLVGLGLAVLLIVGGGVVFGKKVMNKLGVGDDKTESSLPPSSQGPAGVQPKMIIDNDGDADNAMAPGSGASTASSATAPSVSPGVTVEGKTTVVTLEAGSFYYTPKEIKVKQGTHVKIVMTSKDMMHDFNIDELKVKLPITKAGQTNTVEFDATTKGKFEYYCSVGQHRERGQVGTLIVE